RDVVRRISEQPREASAHEGGLLRRALPFVVDELRRIEPRALLRLEALVWPCLMRVPRQQHALRHAEARVVRRERRRQRWLRISHRSGNNGLESVVARYAAPVDPPVPRLVPIVRSTIFTWR